MGIFSRLRDRRRQKLVKAMPIPDGRWEWVMKEHRILRSLSSEEGLRLRNLATVFLAEKRFHPVGGIELDDDFRVSVAAQACLPVLNLGIDWYRSWKTVIVTGDAYGITRTETDEAGVVHEYQDELGGELLGLGPVVLSKADVEASGWGDGYNVPIHEAAHVIDGADGSFDGCPALPRDIDPEEWRSVFTAAYEKMRSEKRGGIKRVRGGRGARVRIDPYAAFSADEFFAVCVEYFFEKPVVLRGDFPEVYALLVRFFRQDPYGRL
ncbi:MAG: hypothetical protein A2Z99_15375 [Treponema sp. GWB1_62_6]|nr:MAG: hypothetical protein A2Z99_15375 [Treponema sp. GWB1_62_6]OHE68683.1 MAG: hypothetical protein A2001_06090 [Treponema sp. GWC1_61_84]OHE70415.1 MAG: hypothetical protein A2413_15055 [Treponema sp. RIFOXYC1_FULL_61_9]